MALPELKQAHTIIDRSAHILLMVPERASVDALAAMMALYLTLQPHKEDGVEAVSPAHVPPPLQFLPGSSQIKMQPRQQTDVIMDIAGPTKIEAIRQEVLQGGLRLHLTLPTGITITRDQLEMVVRPLPYDVAIILGAADLEALGKTFTDHTDFFYNTPIINIDHRADNEHYGTVNIVDITAGSVAEVTYELITSKFGEEISPEVATALYAGIVAGTDSFQKPSTTPRSFQIAAKLMEREADREAVIQHLIKTKPLYLIKLAGRLYARLRFDEHMQLFWSILRPVDFQDSGATMEHVPAAMRELANNIAGFNAAFILHENSEGFMMYLLLGKGLQQRRQEIQTQLEAKRDNGLLHVRIHATSLEDAEQEALDKVRAILP
ncbi:MAG: DHH family phosphoesterase [Candidatus Andersenbacteria bacterium]